MDLLPIVIANSFKIQNQTFGKHFHFLALTLWSWNLSFFLGSISKIHNDKSVQNEVHLFHANVDIKAMFTFLKKCIHKCKHSWTKDEKTAPSWSSILMLLMTINKFSEFGRICVDQSLNFVFEGCAILHGIPLNSSVVPTFGIDLVSSWTRWVSRPCGNDRNSIVLDQYEEQLSVGHWKWMVHFGLFSFLALVIA